MTAAGYGTTSDLWGTTWTPADINASNFGVALSANSSGTGATRTASVDYIQITVTYTADTTAPTVSSIAPTSAQTNASSMNFTVTFSEAVNGVDAGNFSLTTSGVTGAAITGVSGSGATRTVAVDTGSGDGTIRLDLSSTTPAITDIAGNPLTATFTNGSLLTVDRTPPQITAPDVNALATGLTTPVTLAATATDTVDPSVAVTYWIGSTQISSGHPFPLGPTTVTAKASDAVGNAATPVDFTVTVNKRAITVTAVTASKPYDGDTSSSGAPVVGGDGLAPGDAGTYVQTYDTKDVGTGKTLTPVVTITSGGVGDPGTWPGYYDVALSSVSDGAITKAGLTVTASGIDKPYDGSLAASVTLASDKVAGDTLTLSYTSASLRRQGRGRGQAGERRGHRRRRRRRRQLRPPEHDGGDHGGHHQGRPHRLLHRRRQALRRHHRRHRSRAPARAASSAART